MVEIPAVTAAELPRFLGRFLTSSFIASWLGVQVISMSDLQEYVLARMDAVDPALMNELFRDSLPGEDDPDFNDRIPCDGAEKFMAAVLGRFPDIQRFFGDRGDDFMLELQFRLPFIHKSRFSGATKKKLLSMPKARYHSSYRQNCEGQLIIAGVDLMRDAIERGGTVLVEFPVIGNDLSGGVALRLFLRYPEPLALYWETAVGAILTRGGQASGKGSG